MKKNNLTTAYPAASIRPCFPGETPKAGMAAIFNRNSPVLADLVRKVLPSATGLFMICTLILHFTIGPGAARLIPLDSADLNDAAAGRAGLENVESLGPEYGLINRGDSDDVTADGNRITKTDSTTVAETATPVTETAAFSETATATEAADAATTSTTFMETAQSETVIETTLSPNDANGVEREKLTVDQFTISNQALFLQVNSANIRQLPTTETEIAGKLVYGESCTQVSYGSCWSRITTSGGIEGYILTDFLGVNPPPTPTPVPTATPTPVPVKVTAAPVVSVPVAAGSSLTAEQQQTMIDLARSCLGVRYVYGSEDMSGFDCSGFTTYIYQQMFGITLPRSAKTQAGAGLAVSSSDIQVGDILCFDWSGGDGVCDHVGLYIGSGQYIHASYSKGYVLESTVNFSRNPIVSIRRIIH